MEGVMDFGRHRPSINVLFGGFADGTDGANGMSAYEVAVKNGFSGTEAEWLESLKGDGKNGLSAYQIWLNEGHIGSEQEFLDSLVGATGPAGEDGADGLPGPQGVAGERGPAGPSGSLTTTATNSLPAMEAESLSGKITLNRIAKTGKYSDLIEKPVLSDVAISGEYNDLKNTPILSEVAYTGKYSDLRNIPEASFGSTFYTEEHVQNVANWPSAYNVIMTAENGVRISDSTDLTFLLGRKSVAGRKARYRGIPVGCTEMVEIESLYPTSDADSDLAIDYVSHGEPYNKYATIDDIVRMCNERFDEFDSDKLLVVVSGGGQIPTYGQKLYFGTHEPTKESVAYEGGWATSNVVIEAMEAGNVSNEINLNDSKYNGMTVLQAVSAWNNEMSAREIIGTSETYDATWNKWNVVSGGNVVINSDNHATFSLIARGHAESEGNSGEDPSSEGYAFPLRPNRVYIMDCILSASLDGFGKIECRDSVSGSNYYHYNEDGIQVSQYVQTGISREINHNDGTSERLVRGNIYSDDATLELIRNSELVYTEPDGYNLIHCSNSEGSKIATYKMKADGSIEYKDYSMDAKFHHSNLAVHDMKLAFTTGELKIDEEGNEYCTPYEIETKIGDAIGNASGDIDSPNAIFLDTGLKIYIEISSVNSSRFGSMAKGVLSMRVCESPFYNKTDE